MKFFDYELIQKCGSGAYGEVWVARALAGRLVALKIIEKNEQISREFAGLRNYSRIFDFKYLIRIFHVGESENKLYYTMELADNLGTTEQYVPATLENVLKQKGRISSREIVMIGQKILWGISALHKAGLVHRDIKPENILFVNGVPKLSDIGLLRSVSQTLSMGGTLGFIPPEKVSSGVLERTSSDDLYALGKVLYCCLTGNNVEKWPTFPGTLVNDDCKKLNRVILTACAKSKFQRFKNVEEFENALNWGVPKRKYVYSILLRYWYWIAGTMICTGFFLFGTLFPSQYKNTSYREEHVSLEDTALILGEIANRVNFDFAVSDGTDEYNTGSFEDPIYRKFSPFKLDGEPRLQRTVLTDSFENWAHWETENSHGFNIYRNVLSIGNYGTIYLKDQIETPYAIRFELDCSALMGRVDFRITAFNSQKHERSYYQCSLTCSEKAGLLLLPLEYQPENDRKIMIKPIKQPESHSGFHTIELVQTEKFFRFYMDGKLMIHAPSFFFGGYLGITADRASIHNSVYIRNLQIFRIDTVPGCSEENQYHLKKKKKN